MTREEERRTLFKTTIANDDGRRRRQETTRQIRKAKKDENLLKRRMAIPAIAPSSSDDTETMSGGKKTKTYSTVDIPELTKTLRNPTATLEQKEEATRGFRRILSVDTNPPVEAVLQAGILPDLIRNLTAVPSASNLIFESAWALTNIASTDHTDAIVTAGVVTPLIQLLRHSVADVREQAIWCLGNIAGDNVGFRDHLLEQGALEPVLLNIQNPSTMSMLQNATWTCSNLCRGKPAPPLEHVAPVIPCIANLLRGHINVSEAVLTDAIWALSYVSDGENDRIQIVIDADVIHSLVSFLSVKDSLLLTPTLRCLGNLVTGNDEQTQKVLDANILDHLEELMGSSRKTIRKESCWLASNIAAGTKNQIAMLMHRRGILNALIENATHSTWEVRKEAIWALANICTTGDEVQVMGLVQYEGVRPLIDLLAFKNADAPVLVAALEAIEQVLLVGDRHGKDYCTLLDEYNGIDNLENLQEHPSDSVYKKTVHIIETYFGADEQEDENLAPTMTDNGTFAFGLSSPKQLFPSDGNTAAPVFQFGVSNRAF